MPVIIDDVEYITTKEAATIAGRSVDTIGIWCRERKVKARQDGAGRWLVNRLSLDKFIKGEKDDANKAQK